MEKTIEERINFFLGDIDEQEDDSKYQEFFRKKLEKWKISSPTELSDADKKKFFSEIEKEWTHEKNGS
jgi:Mg2+/Co2+ transporter CorC